MVAFPRLFAKKEQPAYDYEAAANELVETWDRLFSCAIEHAQETNMPVAIEALVGALNTITQKGEAFASALNAYQNACSNTQG